MVKSRSSAASMAVSGRGTTAASMRCPHSWSGTPNTTASSTAGCLSRTSSISAGAMFSAPRMIVSSVRPLMNR